MSLHVVLDLETVVGEEFAEELERAAIQDRIPPPPCHTVVCAGFAVLEDLRVREWGVVTGGEDGILRRLASSLEALDGTGPLCLVGLNTRGFDLPVLAARCLRWGVPLRWYYGRDGGRGRYSSPRYRYSDASHLDLMDVLSDHGASARASLSVWARLVGWPGKLGVSGADVAGMVADGRIEAVADYCLGDVATAAALLLRSELLRGRLSLAAYREAAAALLARAEGDVRTAGLAAAVDRESFLLGGGVEEAPAPSPAPRRRRAAGRAAG